MPGHPTNLAHQYANLDSTEPTALSSGAGGDFSIFFLSDIISVFYFPLFERHIDIDRNTISKSSLTKTNLQPTKLELSENLTIAPLHCFSKALLYIRSNK